MGIEQNFRAIMDRIERAADKSDRSRESVKLVVVTKKQPVEAIHAAVAAGARILGENYPEEAASKIQVLSDDRIKWHMIGHLQSRKARLVASDFDYFHALDSLRLAEKVDQALSAARKILPVLLEINTGFEESKNGWRIKEGGWEDLLEDVSKILELKNLRIQGLMTMPPLGEQPEQSRQYFQTLRKIQENLSRQFPLASWQELSMGTSSDFEVAIQEGATFVRIGQAILGARPYRQ